MCDIFDKPLSVIILAGDYTICCIILIPAAGAHEAFSADGKKLVSTSVDHKTAKAP